jgi:hypothetical protein
MVQDTAAANDSAAVKYFAVENVTLLHSVQQSGRDAAQNPVALVRIALLALAKLHEIAQPLCPNSMSPSSTQMDSYVLPT